MRYPTAHDQWALILWFCCGLVAIMFTAIVIFLSCALILKISDKLSRRKVTKKLRELNNG